MRAVIQRVSQAQVVINTTRSEEIEKGLVVLIGIAPEDTQEDIDWIVKKLLTLRLFDDAEGFMNQSVEDILGDLLLISQFTLFASVKKGTRPSFSAAANPKEAEAMYHQCVQTIRSKTELVVCEGEFAVDMQVSLTNDGPVTLMIDSKNKKNVS